MEKTNYHWYILAMRGGREAKIIQEINSELEKTEWKKNVRELKVFNDNKGKNFLKGYILCYCLLTPQLVRFFYKIPNIIGFLNYQWGSEKLPDFVSPEVIKSFSAKVKEEVKNVKVNRKVGLNVGDLVTVMSGIFANYEGKITYLDEKKKKVKIDIEFAGKITSIDIPVSDCQKNLV